jgi:glutathione S-transferase
MEYVRHRIHLVFITIIANFAQLEDLHIGQPLLPPHPKNRAHSRLWSDHINRNIVPQFYRFLQEQDSTKQMEHAAEFKTQIAKLVEAAHPQGPFFLGPEITFVDVQIAPWMIRLKRVLKPYRGWPDAEPGSRWKAWIDAVEEHEAIRATTSGDELYLDSYERYAGEVIFVKII